MTTLPAPPSESPPGPTSASPTDSSPISTIGADRFCARCGYNLIGQSVVREARHALLIVRCPECGTVAGVQEYPQLGPWAARLKVMVVALWLLFIFAQIPMTSGIMVSFCDLMNDIAADRYGDDLQEIHAEAVRAAEAEAAAVAGAGTDGDAGTDTGTDTGTGTGTDADADEDALVAAALGGAGIASTTVSSTFTLPDGSIIRLGGSRTTTSSTLPIGDFNVWWKQQNADAIYQTAGGWFGVLDPVACLALIPMTLTCFTIGVIWSIYLLAIRRKLLLLWGATFVGLATVFLAIYLASYSGSYAWFAAHRAARDQMVQTTAPLTLSILSVALIAGVWFGRPCVRLAVRLMLPPRQRSALALLWRTDGLDLPGTKT